MLKRAPGPPPRCAGPAGQVGGRDARGATAARPRVFARRQSLFVRRAFHSLASHLVVFGVGAQTVLAIRRAGRRRHGECGGRRKVGGAARTGTQRSKVGRADEKKKTRAGWGRRRRRVRGVWWTTGAARCVRVCSRRGISGWLRPNGPEGTVRRASWVCGESTGLCAGREGRARRAPEWEIGNGRVFLGKLRAACFFSPFTALRRTPCGEPPASSATPTWQRLGPPRPPAALELVSAPGGPRAAPPGRPGRRHARRCHLHAPATFAPRLPAGGPARPLPARAPPPPPPAAAA